MGGRCTFIPPPDQMFEFLVLDPHIHTRSSPRKEITLEEMVVWSILEMTFPEYKIKDPRVSESTRNKTMNRHVLQMMKKTETDDPDRPLETPTFEKFGRNLRYTKQMGDQMCSVCCQNYKVREKTKLLPCGHLFHHGCLQPWYTQHHATCPLCRQNLQWQK